MSNGRGSSGNVISALASFFIPGLGQLLQGRVLAAIIFFLIASVGYTCWWLIFPAIIAGIAHLWSILDAALWKPRG